MSELQTIRIVDDVRKLVEGWHSDGERIALVPTMGNLHDGHLSLVQLARRQAGRVVVSIFVNPTQFGVGEDFTRYPRTLAADGGKLVGDSRVDALFVPADQEIYPFGLDEAVRVLVPKLSEELCGATRPGHFEGVTSVVCRFLNIVSPDVLVLGEKDYQQLIVLRRMVEDLRMPVRVVSGPICREPDGLAMSSRNQYLTAEERRIAPALNETLRRTAEALRAGGSDYAALESEARARLQAEGFRPDYVEVRRLSDLARPGPGAAPETLLVLGAAWLGHTRLIDNVRG